MFTRSGETRTQQGAKLTRSGEVGEGYFGIGAALSSEGNTALVTGAFDNGGLGAASVFTATPAEIGPSGPTGACDIAYSSRPRSARARSRSQ